MSELCGIDPFSVRVSAYANLRTGGWSIKTAERVVTYTELTVPVGKVIGHADALVLTDAVFVTKPAAIARMVAGDGPRGRKRNVFAWVTGWLTPDAVVLTERRRVTFHPFERPDFFDAQNGETVTRADTVWLDADGKCWVPA